jgi:hypothetical protein
VKARRTLLLLGFLLAAGCSRPPITTRPPAVLFSPFLNSLDSEWDKLINDHSRLPDRNLKWDERVREGGEPVSTPEYQTIKHGFKGVCHCEDADGQRVECRPEDIKRFMNDVRLDLRNRLNPASSELVMAEVEDNASYGFDITYKMGNASGTIKGRASPVGAGKDGSVTVTIRLEETARPVP